MNKNTNKKYIKKGYVFAPYISLHKTPGFMKIKNKCKNCKDFYNRLSEDEKLNSDDFYYEIKSEEFKPDPNLGENPILLFPISKITTARFYGIYEGNNPNKNNYEIIYHTKDFFR